MIGLLLSVIGLIVQIIVPGWLLIRLFGRRDSLSDAFSAGLVLMAIVILGCTLVFTDLRLLSYVSRATVAMVSGFAILILIRQGADRGEEWLAIKSALGRFPLGLSLLSMGALAVFVLTHNLGFDDIAHLKYLSDVEGNTFFPVFIEVREEWSVARYPMFGLMHKTLGLGIPAAGFFMYYMLGAVIFIGFLATCYDKVLTRCGSTKWATSVYLVVLAVLAVGSFDNYLNFGLYPVQQAKLLFLTGLIHLLSFRQKRDGVLIIFLGGALLAVSLIYHFNMVLLAPIAILVGVIVTLSQRKNPRALSVIVSIMIIPVMVGMLALKPDGSFIRYEKKIEMEIVSGEQVEVAEPTFIEEIRLRLVGLVSWFRDGHYRDFYIARVYSSELVLVPSTVLVGLLLGPIPLAYPLSIGIFLVALGLQAVKLPYQIASGLLQSGPWFIVIDFLRADDRSEMEAAPVVWTDEYTALVLRGMGMQNIEALAHRTASLVFSPLVGFHAYRSPMGHDGDISEQDRGWLALNSRYWGVGSLKKFGIEHSITIPDVTKALDDLVSHSRRYHAQELALEGIAFVADVVDAPLVGIPAERHDEDRPTLLPDGQGQTLIYRDSALINVDSLREGEKLTMAVDGIGDFLEFSYRVEDGSTLRKIPDKCFHKSEYRGPLEDVNFRAIVDHALREIVFFPKRDLSQIQFFIVLEIGHLGGGLGEIHEVNLSSDPLFGSPPAEFFEKGCDDSVSQ